MTFASFDYYMVLPGVVAALSLGRLLKGAALSLQRPEVKWHPLHVAWAVILFVSQIISWHESAACRGCVDIGTSLWHYLAFLGFPTTIYLASTVLTPEKMPADEGKQKLDLGEHYYSHAVSFFMLCAVALVIAIITNTVLPCGAGGAWLSMENLFRLVGVAIALVLAHNPENKRLHCSLTWVSALLVAVFAWKFW